MARLNRRSRVISIRLSDEEFCQLQNMCESRGIENLSEIARSAMRHLMLQDREPNRVDIALSVTHLQTRMGVLDREIERMLNLMGLARLEG